jgi:hypothetical protein
MTPTAAPIAARRPLPSAADAPAPAETATKTATLNRTPESDRYRAAATNPSSGPQTAVDLADPPIMARNKADVEQGTDSVRRVDGELFVGGPSLDDPKQGWAGDCYLIASMSALADAAPTASAT